MGKRNLLADTAEVILDFRESEGRLFYTILDSKKECLGYYYDGDIHEQKPDIGKHYVTWQYDHHHHQEGVEYLSLYCGGKPISDFCPPYLERELEISRDKKNAFSKAITNSKIRASDVCAQELLPSWFLKEISQLKCEILREIFSTQKKPESYDFMLELEKLFGQISQNELTVDLSPLQNMRGKTAVRNFIKRVSGKTTIKYNQFGTITGRLTTTSDSFPIMNLNRSFRKILKPNNDLFVEFDYNAAELRTMMALAGATQPQEDVHEWNMKNIFFTSNREQAKKRVFAWLYNPNSVDEALDRAYNRKKVLSQYWNGISVKNPFGREIGAQEHYALNYIIQSTTNDLVLRQILKVNDLLRGKKSKIVFLIHDSFVLDLDKNEKDLVLEIAKIFSQSKFGDFMVNIKAGKDFGNMKEVSL